MADEGIYPLAEDPPPPAPTWPDIVPDGPTCRRCGYELKGLPMKGQCPECGLPVARSLRGNLLEYSDPTFVRRLAMGALLVEVAILGFCAVPIGAILMVTIGKALSLSGTIEEVLSAAGAVVSIAAAVVGLLGLFVLTARDPALAGTDESDRSRLITRWATVVCAAGWACASVIAMLPTVASIAPARFAMLLKLSTAAATIALWVQIIASLFYLRHLAVRIPHAGLREEITATKTLAVTALVCIVATVGFGAMLLGCVGMLSGLIALVLLLVLVIRYADVVDRTRRHLGRIARAQTLSGR